MTLRTRRRALAGVLAAAALAFAAAPAGASSIVYVKDGNVWLTDADGAKQYQVTFDGGYTSPSQADDGTIVAWRAKQHVRMDRSGRQLNPPVDSIGRDDGGGQFYGPCRSPRG
jgi:predicted lipoprotein with Yx(FWY)xxD motif